MKKSYSWILFSILMTTMALLGACSPAASTPTLEQVSPLSSISPISEPDSTSSTDVTRQIAPVTPVPSKSAIQGQVISVPSDSKPLAGVVVRLARVFWNEQKTDGAFALEAARSPSTHTDADGDFFFSNLEPADYVIVIGELQGDHVIISESDGKAKIFTAEPEKIVNVGKLEVDLQ